MFFQYRNFVFFIAVHTKALVNENRFLCVLHRRIMDSLTCSKSCLSINLDKANCIYIYSYNYMEMLLGTLMLEMIAVWLHLN